MTATLHDCDLCGSARWTALEQDPRVAVCDVCGFIFVPLRRTNEEIARAWDDVWNQGYDPTVPGVLARLWYVAEWIGQREWLRGRELLDIGAGQAQFLTFAEIEWDARRVAGLDPCKENCSYWVTHGLAGPDGPDVGLHDIVTLNWTLENTGDCMAVLRYARDHLKPDGRIVVATGSRILVPFKKPLSHYLAPQRDADLHCFRWSANSLASALRQNGFTDIEFNDYQDRDELIVTGVKADMPNYPSATDDPMKVHDFFAEWERLFP